MIDILLTGTSGFVGTNLIKYLGEGFFIKKLNARYSSGQTFEINSQIIIHLAGKAHDLKKVSRPSDYYEGNYELTKQLYDAFLQSDASKFIYISSVKAVADVVNNVLLENVIPNPLTDYGKSKLMAEQYIQSQPLPDGKSYFILRPCMIHGPGNKGNLNLLYKFIRLGIPYPLAAFENRRSFLSVENLCFIIKELAIESSVPSGVYQVSDDKALSTNEVVSILAKSINKKARLWYIPSNLIRILAKLGDKLKLPLNTERLNKLTGNYIVSNAKIRKALNIEFPLSSIEGLKATAESFKI